MEWEEGEQVTNMWSGQRTPFEVTFFLTEKVLATYCVFTFEDYHVSPLSSSSSSTVGGRMQHYREDNWVSISYYVSKRVSG